MQWVYNFIIKFYYFTIVCASPFNLKAKVWLEGRKNLIEKLKIAIGKNSNIIWFHCASLGEFEQGRPVIEAYRKIEPNHKTLLTFFSPSGYDIRKNYNGADWVFYLPLDTNKNVKQFLNIVKPQKVVFVKYEFWYNFLNQLHKNNVPVYLISAIFRKEQMFFKWYGSWYRKILKIFTHIFVQNEESEILLKSINVNNVTIAGDTRFDRVYEIATNCKNISEVQEFSDGYRIIVIGSAWQQDEDVLIPFINKAPQNIKFIIAPHEIKESGLCRLEKNITIPIVRFSQAKQSNLKIAKVLVIDNVGMLSSLYKYGNIAYIGGGFGKGIHNILEAAVFGLPVVFGANYKKFSEAVNLISEKGAFCINNDKELEHQFNELLENETFYNNASNIAKTFVKNRIGATKKILENIVGN